MPPNLVPHDQSDQRRRDAILRRQSTIGDSTGGVRLSDHQNLFISQLCLRVFFPNSWLHRKPSRHVATLIQHVCRVLRVRSQKQVERLEASAVVAVVADQIVRCQVFDHESVGKRTSDPMDVFIAVSPLDQAIAVALASCGKFLTGLGAPNIRRTISMHCRALSVMPASRCNRTREVFAWSQCNA